MNLQQAAKIAYSGYMPMTEHHDTFLSLRVETEYHPGQKKWYVPGWNEPQGDPFIERTGPEIEEMKFFFEADNDVEIEVKEKHLPEYLVRRIEMIVNHEIEEREWRNS